VKRLLANKARIRHDESSKQAHRLLNVGFLFRLFFDKEYRGDMSIRGVWTTQLSIQENTPRQRDRFEYISKEDVSLKHISRPRAI
jgi:hypothetical protein